MWGLGRRGSRRGGQMRGDRVSRNDEMSDSLFSMSILLLPTPLCLADAVDFLELTRLGDDAEADAGEVFTDPAYEERARYLDGLPDRDGSSLRVSS